MHDDKKRKRAVSVRLKPTDILVLINNLVRAKKNPLVGYVDCQHSYNELLQKMHFYVYLQRTEVESLLWSCNLMNEIGMFEHPDDISFNTFLSRIIPRNHKFDKYFNLILPIKKEEGEEKDEHKS